MLAWKSRSGGRERTKHARVKNIMADADSLIDVGNSEDDRDLSEAEDADIEEDEASLDG